MTRIDTPPPSRIELQVRRVTPSRTPWQRITGQPASEPHWQWRVKNHTWTEVTGTAPTAREAIDAVRKAADEYEADRLAKWQDDNGWREVQR